MSEVSPPPEPWVKFDPNMLSGYAIQSAGSAIYTLTLIAVYNLRKADKSIPPFYHLFFWFGVVDVIHSIALIWMNFSINAIHGDKFEVINYVASLLTCFCYIANMIGNGLMAINRYSATYNSHHKHFSEFRTKLYIILALIASAIFSIPAALRQKHFQFDYATRDWVFKISPMALFHVQRYIILSFMVLYFLVAAIFTLMARNRIAHFIHKDKYHKSDRTLIFFVAVHILLHVCMLIYEIGELIVYDFIVFKFIHEYLYFSAFNLITVSNGFVILFTTEKVKKAVFKTARLFGTNKVSNQSNTQNQQVFSLAVTY